MDDYRVNLSLGRETFPFIFNGGPLSDIDLVSPYVQRLGIAIAAWAQLERHLDAILIHINQERYSKTLYNQDHPVSLKNKLSLLRKWFNQHKALSAELDDFRALKSRIKEISVIRNRIMHFAIDFYDGSTNTATITGFCQGENGLQLSRVDYNIEQIGAFIDATIMCNSYLTRISKTIFTLEKIELLKKR
jgi:hypothetical protein